MLQGLRMLQRTNDIVLPVWNHDTSNVLKTLPLLSIR